MSAVGNLKWQWTPPRRSYSLGIELFSRARPLPLLWRALKSDSIPAANGDRFIQDRGAGFTLRKQLSETSEISVTPFYARTENYPVLQPTTNRWQFHTYSNRGFLFHLTGRLWKFGLENDFAYNKDYLRVFPLFSPGIALAAIRLGRPPVMLTKQLSG